MLKLLKSAVGMLLGALVFAVLMFFVGGSLGWLGEKGQYIAMGIGVVWGGILGWWFPSIFVDTLLFFVADDFWD